jgi:hypothetical protein
VDRQRQAEIIRELGTPKNRRSDDSNELVRQIADLIRNRWKTTC